MYGTPLITLDLVSFNTVKQGGIFPLNFFEIKSIATTQNEQKLVTQLKVQQLQ